MKSHQVTLSGSIGLNTDIPSWELPGEAITEGVNFRCYSGMIFSAGGYSEWASRGVDNFPGYIHYVASAAGTDIWVVGCRTSVEAFDGSLSYDISAGSTAVNEMLWTMANLANILIANNPGSFPSYWSPIDTSVNMEYLEFSPGVTWQAADKSCSVMRTFKNMIFALGLTGVNEVIPHGYRWSHPADANSLPFTWDESDPSAIAGKGQLSGDLGKIYDGLSLRDSFLIYSERGITSLDFIGGEFIFRSRIVTEAIGILGTNCVVSAENYHLFMSDGDIYKTNGTTFKSILAGKVLVRYLRDINHAAVDKCYAVSNPSAFEAWFCIPTNSSDTPDVAYVYNWREDNWSVRSLPISNKFASYGRHIHSGGTWDSQTLSWDDAGNIWRAEHTSPVDNVIVAVSDSNSSIAVLDTLSGDDIVRDKSFIGRSNLDISAKGDISSIVTIYPSIKTNVPVDIQFGTQAYIDAPIIWKPAVTFQPSQRKLDIRLSSELIAWRISSNEDHISGRWIYSGMRITYVNGGTR